MAKKRSRPNWKFAEDRLAALFNTKRRPLSGSLSFHSKSFFRGQKKERGDDGLHERIWLESKYGAQSPLVNYAWDLYDKSQAQCTAETKDKLYPVIGLQKSSRQGILICVHSKHLEKLCLEFLTQNGYKVTKDG
jgi:hypothetical protein